MCLKTTNEENKTHKIMEYCYNCEKVVNKTYPKSGYVDKFCWVCLKKVKNKPLTKSSLMAWNHGHKRI